MGKRSSGRWPVASGQLKTGRAWPLLVWPLLYWTLTTGHRPLFGEVLDRIAVTVDKQVITESDVIRYLRVAAFLDQKPVDLSPASRREAAGRLVDQILILKEAADSHFTLPVQEDAAKLVDLQKPQFGGEEQFRAALAKYQISESDLADHLLAGLKALRFTDLRFRPEIQISNPDVLAERIMQELDKWLETARTQSQIVYKEAAFK